MSGKKQGKAKKAAQAEALLMVTQVARNARTALSRQLLDLGLYAGQDGVMLALDGHDGQTPGAIAAALGVKAPTITKTIGRLATQGFVRREGSADDKRMMLVYLTGAGRDQIKAVRDAQRRTEEAAFNGLKKKHINQLLELLRAVDRNITVGLASVAAPPGSENEGTGASPPGKDDRGLDNEPLQPSD